MKAWFYFVFMLLVLPLYTGAQFMHTESDRMHIGRDNKLYEVFIGERTVKWEVWCSDLIDWSHYYLLDDRTGNKYVAVFTSHQQPRDVLQVLVDTIQHGTHLYHGRLVGTSKIARMQFLSLLKRTVKPIRTFPGYEEFDGVYRNIPASLQMAQILIEDWEKFAKKYKSAHYLSGYASLYACILRTHWKRDVNDVIPQLHKLEQNYKDIKSIALMASWYRMSFLFYLGESRFNIELKHLLHTYGKYKWWVVEASRKLQHSHIPSNSNIHQLEDKSPENLIRLFYYTRSIIWKNLTYTHTKAHRPN